MYIINFGVDFYFIDDIIKLIIIINKRKRMNERNTKQKNIKDEIESQGDER